MIHCTAGKDRTGFAAALILKALGVADDLIVEDYLLTNRFYRRAEAGLSSDMPEEVRDVLGSVEASFLLAALDTVRSDYGDLEAYFEAGLGPRAARAGGAGTALSGGLKPGSGRGQVAVVNR